MALKPAPGLIAQVTWRCPRRGIRWSRRPGWRSILTVLEAVQGKALVDISAGSVPWKPGPFTPFPPPKPP